MLYFAVKGPSEGMYTLVINTENTLPFNDETLPPDDISEKLRSLHWGMEGECYYSREDDRTSKKVLVRQLEDAGLLYSAALEEAEDIY